ncbi:hypothetical protein [Sulfuriferula sp.]|uniref:hypothetical protein n=1 Tax=Sulfuriferula sp. TaxID=2025307 RepID=UPI0027320EFA|nr:hypothetical protein [Sulfuriferula sp.]MDP2025047.1 hypothetical protein [Sulfuriferula sp.]
MAYKRKARIVFFCASHPAPANLAAHYANTLGSDWMEARAAVLPGVAGEVPVLDGTALAWADLLVTLDAAALAARPPLRAGLQHRHYPFEPIPDVADKTAWRELAARIQQRVEGMIGGMRLLQKAARASDGL